MTKVYQTGDGQQAVLAILTRHSKIAIMSSFKSMWVSFMNYLHLLCFSGLLAKLLVGIHSCSQRSGGHVA